MSKSKGFNNLGSQYSGKSVEPLNQKVLDATAKIKSETQSKLATYRSRTDSPAALLKSRSADGQTATSNSAKKEAEVIYIKERYSTMLRKDPILRNPLRAMGYENEDILSAGEFGAVLARAGVGKTAFLVQLSLNALLRGKNVLHISTHIFVCQSHN